jgi:hypothetical protein
MTPGLSCAGGRAADTAVGGDELPSWRPSRAMRSERDVGVEKRDVPPVIRFRNDALDQVPAEHRHAHQRLAALGGIDGVPEGSLVSRTVRPCVLLGFGTP